MVAARITLEWPDSFILYFKVAHFVHFVQQSTLFITPTKCTILINANIKGTSPKCFGTSVLF